MPAFQIIRALDGVLNNASSNVTSAGVRLALPLGGDGDFLLSNIGYSDIHFALGDNTVTCNATIGDAACGTPMLARSQPILKIRPGITHIYLITAASQTSTIVITPGAGT